MGLRPAVKLYIGDFHSGYKGASPAKFQNPESYPPHKPARPTTNHTNSRWRRNWEPSLAADFLPATTLCSPSAATALSLPIAVVRTYLSLSPLCWRTRTMNNEGLDDENEDEDDG